MSEKRFDHFMSRLGNGLCGWLSYQQTRAISNIYSEYLLYGPIFEIAKARLNGDDRIIAQWPIPSSEKCVGRPPAIDFLIRTSEGEVKHQDALLEVKYIPQKKPFTGNINSDIKKMCAVNTSQVKNCSSIVRYMMLVGTLSGFRNLARKKSLAKALRNQISNALKRTPMDQFLSCGHGPSHWALSVLILPEQKLWFKLKSSTGKKSMDELASHELEEIEADFVE